MSLKREKPEIDDFEEEEKFGSKEKLLNFQSQYFKKIFLKFLTDTLAKISQNIFAFYWFQNLRSLFLF